MNSSKISLWIIRFPRLVQRCPAVPNAAQYAPSTALSMFAEGITTNGFLPPNSKEQETRFRPQTSPIILPTGVEPVKLILFTNPSSTASTRYCPAPLPRPWTRLITPSGSPASCIILVSMNDRSGESWGLFQTQVLPHIIAGIIFQNGTAAGKLHALIIPQTPRGLR